MKVCIKRGKKNKKNKKVKINDKMKKAIEVYRKEFVDEILDE